MLNVGVFDDFKGARTLLLWGDKNGMAELHEGLTSLRDGACNVFAVDADDIPLLVAATKGPPVVRATETGLRWDCPQDTLELAVDLVEPLLDGTGHQYIDTEGTAVQVMIARGEYPPSLR